MKKWYMLCIVLLFSLVLAACGDNEEEADSDASDADTEENAENGDEAEADAEESDEEAGNEEEEDIEDPNAGEESLGADGSQQYDIDPNGENEVTLRTVQNGVTLQLTYKADGDNVYEQTAENEMPYETLGVSTPEEAEEQMASTAAEFQGITGVTHDFEYTDDRVLETLEVDLDAADLEEVSELMGTSVTENGDLSQGISLQQSIDMLLSQGYEIVDGDAPAASEADDNASSDNNEDLPQLDIDPNGENSVTMELAQNGVHSMISYEADGDMVYEQSTENEIPFSSLGVSSQEEAEQVLEEAIAAHEGVNGVTYDIEYMDDSAIETLTINYDEADPEELSQLPGYISSGNVSNGISLQQSVQMMQAEGFQIVEE